MASKILPHRHYSYNAARLEIISRLSACQGKTFPLGSKEDNAKTRLASLLSEVNETITTVKRTSADISSLNKPQLWLAKKLNSPKYHI